MSPDTVCCVKVSGRRFDHLNQKEACLGMAFPKQLDARTLAPVDF